MRHERIEALLKESMGLDVASVGEASIDRATRNRMAACNVSDPAGYAQLVAGSPDELQELIESVVVPETWFFRNAEAFRALARIATEEWMPSHPAGGLRALSFPCSSGEEPYSIAMTLLDANLPRERFSVDGFDISARALGVAAKGVYGRNSFRGADIAFRDRYFRGEENAFALKDEVRTAVNFAQRNLIDEELGAHSAYDVIFCRNLLIYFDPLTQQRVLGKLASALGARGALFVGPSESFQVMASGFTPIPYPQAFVFRKADAPRQKVEQPATMSARPRSRKARAIPAPLPAELPSSGLRPPSPRKRGEGRSMADDVSAASSAAPVESPAELETDLARARQLADAGNLAGALELAKRNLTGPFPSADAYHTLGLIRDAMGDSTSAVDSYRKALYLSPNHVETLIHLALLLERKGDAVAAQRLRERAHRVEERPKP